MRALQLLLLRPFALCLVAITQVTATGGGGSPGNSAHTTEHTTSSPKKLMEWEQTSRLSSSVIPSQYNLFIQPNIDNRTFIGNVVIQLNLTQPTDHIRLHVKALEITFPELLKEGRHRIQIHKTFHYAPHDFYVVQVKEKLTVRPYHLKLHFSGKLSKVSYGFYRSQYYDSVTGQIKYTVSTHLEPTYARQVFPCFDEPNAKARFKLTLVRPSNLAALSNMPIESEKTSKDQTTVTFHASLPMSPHLVAFAIGDFKCSQTSTSGKIPVRVCATSHLAKDTQYAASIAPKILEYYENYFGVKIPLPKIDIAGIPEFASGAMENWGLVFAREERILYNPEKGSAKGKQTVARVVAHELAHFWFGNLVTMTWWNDLWLNEGFASYIAYHGVDAVHPDWQVLSHYASQDLAEVLHKDGQLSSHPIVQEVSNPDQISELFDSISYKKGCLLLRMLKRFLGPENFRRGLSKYLKKFAYKTASTQDLWEALQAEAPTGINVSFVMDTWTRQMGYPLVTVTTDSTSGELLITQQRFLDCPLARNKVQSSPFDFVWDVPLNISCAENRTESWELHWLYNREMTIETCKDSAGVDVNTGSTGFFRVKYDAEALLQGVAQTFTEHYDAEERCGLLDDVFALAEADYTRYATALEFGLVLKDENHAIPWDCASRHLAKLNSLLSDLHPRAYGLYRKYMGELLHEVYGGLEWTDSDEDPHLTRLLKPTIFELACMQGNADCRKQAKTLFLQWLEENKTVPLSLRSVVYRWGMRQSDDEVWDQLWQRYLAETDLMVQDTILRALASSRSPWIIARLLDYGKNETIMKRQSFLTLFGLISSNTIGVPIVWYYFRNNFEYLVERFGLADHHFGRVIERITASFATETHLAEMRSFFARYPQAGAGERSRQSALERVESQVDWAKRSLTPIYKWLKSRYEP